MSLELIIVCRKCKSYRVKKLPKSEYKSMSLIKRLWTAFMFKCMISDKKAGVYRCEACNIVFEVYNSETYVLKNQPDFNRCRYCDENCVELVEKNHRLDSLPSEEIIDLYRCRKCGQRFLNLVKPDPGTLYD